LQILADNASIFLKSQLMAAEAKKKQAAKQPALSSSKELI